MPRILIADDHPILHNAVSRMLEGTAYDVSGGACSGSETIAQVDRTDPDIVLLDIRMPGGTGVEVVRKLRTSGFLRPIIIFTAGLTDLALLEVLSFNVNGILLKQSDPACLIECLDSVEGGSLWIDPEIQNRVLTLTQKASVGVSEAKLSTRDRDIIKLIQKGMHNREIAAELGITEGTARVYLHRIFERLGVNNRTELAVRANEFLHRS